MLSFHWLVIELEEKKGKVREETSIKSILNKECCIIIQGGSTVPDTGLCLTWWQHHTRNYSRAPRNNTFSPPHEQFSLPGFYGWYYEEPLTCWWLSCSSGVDDLSRIKNHTGNKYDEKEILQLLQNQRAFYGLLSRSVNRCLLQSDSAHWPCANPSVLNAGVSSGEFTIYEVLLWTGSKTCQFWKPE